MIMRKEFTVAVALCALSIFSFQFCSVQEKREYIRPEFLKPGDSIGIMTVSSAVEESIEEADSLIQIVESWGVKVRRGENLFKKEYMSFSVSDKERAEEFMRMVKNDNLKAIVFYRGGYGAMRTLPYLDFEEIKRHPKWILGFSDVTTYLTVWSNMGIETIHGAMLNSYYLHKRPDSAAITSCDALFGRVSRYSSLAHKYNRLGSAEGILRGGNMSLLAVGYGTPYEIKMDDPTVLFIEETDENMNTVDRFLQQLFKSGKMQNVKAVLVGNFRRCKDANDEWQGMDIYDLINTYTKDLGIPVIFGFPAGHGRPNNAIYIGRKVKVNVTETGGEVIF